VQTEEVVERRMAEQIKLKVPDLAGWENVPVETQSDGNFRLLNSPVMIDGLARKDVVAVDKDGIFVLISRGGEVSIKFSFATDVSMAAVPEGYWEDVAKRYGLSADSALRGIVVFSALLRETSFKTLEATAEAMVSEFSRFSCSGWWYGNVYDVDGRPLQWW
jgi:hypothetical protein